MSEVTDLNSEVSNSSLGTYKDMNLENNDPSKDCAGCKQLQRRNELLEEQLVTHRKKILETINDKQTSVFSKKLYAPFNLSVYSFPTTLSLLALAIGVKLGWNFFRSFLDSKLEEKIFELELAKWRPPKPKPIWLTFAYAFFGKFL